MILAIYVSRIDASLLQSDFYSLLNLFSLGLLYSHSDFLILHMLGNTLFVDSDGVHGSNLHSHLLHQLLIGNLVE